MKIFINATTLKVGGGKSVLVNFLSSFDRLLNEKIVVYAVVPDVIDYRLLSLVNIKIEFVPRRLNKLINRLELDKWVLKKMSAVSPNVIFSMGNVALPILDVPQLLLFHMAHPLYPESSAWRNMPLREWFYMKGMAQLIKHRIGYATEVLVQTKSASLRFKNIFGSIPTSIVPNGVSIVNNFSETSVYNFCSKGPNLLCLARHYSHKNLEVLIELGKIIKRNNSSICIITTVNKSDSKGSKKFLRMISRNKLDEVIKNVGTVPWKDVPDLYQGTDGLIFPTVLESFSQTYVEAMFYRRPIFTSRLDFALDVCGENAYYFDPHDPQEIYNVVSQAFEDRFEMARKVDRAFQYVNSQPGWPHISEMILKKLKAMAK